MSTDEAFFYNLIFTGLFYLFSVIFMLFFAIPITEYATVSHEEDELELNFLELMKEHIRGIRNIRSYDSDKLEEALTFLFNPFVNMPLCFTIISIGLPQMFYVALRKYIKKKIRKHRFS